MKKIVYFIPLFLLSACNSLRAQSASTPASSSITQITLGQSIVALNGPWKFHIGDSPEATGSQGPQWASPDFDDSQWETVNLPHIEDAPSDPDGFFARNAPGWTAKGHPGYWGYAWYRIRVRVSVHPAEKLALAGPSRVSNGYQVFANGVLLGSFGKFSGHEKNPIVYSADS